MDLTYGDVSFDAVFQGLTAAAPPEGGTFFDLGSGSGRAVIAVRPISHTTPSHGTYSTPAYVHLTRHAAPSYHPTIPESYHSTVPPSHHATIPQSHHPTIPPSHHPTILPSHQAALLFHLRQCVGVELLQGLHEQAVTPAHRFEELRTQLNIGNDPVPEESPTRVSFRFEQAHLAALDPRRVAASVQFVCCDLFDVDVCSADVVFVCCASWEPPIMFRLADRLAEQLKEGARVLTVGKPLRAAVELAGKRVRFDEVWHGWARVQWGEEPLVLHRVTWLWQVGVATGATSCTATGATFGSAAGIAP